MDRMKPIKPRNAAQAAALKKRRTEEMQSDLASGRLKVHRLESMSPEERAALERRLRIK